MNSSLLVQVLKSLFPNAMQGSGYTLAVDISGNATIALWNNSLGAQPTSAQLTAGLAALQLQQAQAAQSAVITAAYQTARYASPVSVTLSGGAMSFPTDVDTQNNVMGYLVANLQNQAATVFYPLLDVSNTLRQLSYTDLIALAQAIQASSLAAFEKKMTLLGQIAAATTIAAVQAVVW